MFTYYIMFTSIWMSVSGDSQLVIHNDSIVNDNYDQRVQCSQSLVENLTQTKQDNCTVEYNHLQNTKIDSLKGIILAETRKCCAEGYTLNRTSIEQCVYYNRSLPKLPFTSYNRSESKIQCEWDFHVFDPSKFVDHKFKIDDSGHLLVEKGHYQEFRNSQNYCIDGAVDRKGHLTVITIMWIYLTIVNTPSINGVRVPGTKIYEKITNKLPINIAIYIKYQVCPYFCPKRLITICKI